MSAGKEWMERALLAEEALMELWNEYEDRREQFGDSPLWSKHEDEAAIKNAENQVEWVRRDWDEH